MLSFQLEENAWQGCTFPRRMNSWRGSCWKNVWQYLSLGFISDCFSCPTSPKSIQIAKGNLLVVFPYRLTFLAFCLITQKKWREKKKCVLFLAPDCASSKAGFAKFWAIFNIQIFLLQTGIALCVLDSFLQLLWKVVHPLLQVWNLPMQTVQRQVQPFLFVFVRIICSN